jgi:2-polyprenyl-3-methyl-5-hydroxy-6-metoxy-1,4-benzoquinol methylase
VINPIDTRLTDPEFSRTQSAVVSSPRAFLPGLVDRLRARCRPLVCPFDLLLSHIDPGLAYYDIGCGTGALLRELAQHKRPTALGGVEVSRRLVENTAQALRSSNVPLALAVYAGVNLPAGIDKYDYLLLIDVLHHLPRGRQFELLEQLFQRMNPGQRLLLKDIDADSPLVYWNKLHDLLVSKEIGHERSAELVKRELEHIGFQVQLLFKKRVLLYPHFALLCHKPHNSDGVARRSALVT